MDLSLDPAAPVAGPTQGQFQLDSLPEVVESVSQAQKQQSCEIECHQKILAQLQEKLHKEKDGEEALKKELGTCLKKICLYQEDTTKKKNQCIGLQEAINEEVLTNASLKFQLQTVQQEMEKEERLFQEYRRKIQKHEQLVQGMEAEHTENMALEKQAEIIRDLEGMRDQLKEEMVVDEDSGELVAKVTLEMDIHQLQIERAELQEGYNQLEQEVSKEESIQASIRQDIEVLQKRNQAQLTRLKCQVKEAQLRNWQWSQEATQLENQIQQLTGQQTQTQDA